MALQSNFFGSKRDSDTPAGRTGPGAGPGTGGASLTMPSAAAAGSPISSSSSSSNSAASSLSPSAQNASGPGSSLQPRDAVAPAASADTGGKPDSPSKLTVGPNIKLKGVEITDCDTLVVEGLVEATMDSRVMLVEEEGAFKGSAQVDFAEIRGRFEGTLNARTRLVIRSTGKVTGNVRYGSIVIEEGGQLGGEVHFGPAPSNPPSHVTAIISSSTPARLENVVAM